MNIFANAVQLQALQIYEKSTIPLFFSSHFRFRYM